MGETKIYKKSKQYNAILLDLNKACERNMLHRDMTCFAYLVFSDRLISVNDKLQITKNLENTNEVVILDDTYQIEDGNETFILPSLSYGINIDSAVESKDYEMSLLNSLEYQQYIFTEL
ncbi:MAG: hypothetical protein CML28_03500 [Rhizobiales bacterium]|nr:hypothetical protein [Hyphomicrobiales bacterium]